MSQTEAYGAARFKIAFLGGGTTPTAESGAGGTLGYVEFRVARSDLASCRNCGRPRDEVGPISWGGYCGDCGKALYLENLDGLVTKSGLPWARHRLGRASAAIGDARIVRALLEAGVFAYDQPTEPEVTSDAA